MVNNITEPWILAGYEIFSTDGPKGLKIEVIAKKVGISKSSFYHHFANMQIFRDILLDYHLSRAKLVAEKEKACKNIDPDLINVLLESKHDLLFNRQLRINRTDPKFRKCFEASNNFAKNAMLEIWAMDIGLKHKSKLVDILFTLIVENFYLQITEETLNFTWLSEYFNSLREMAIEI